MEGSDSDERRDLRLVLATFVKPREGRLQSVAPANVLGGRLMIPPRSTKSEVLASLKGLTKFIDNYWAAIVRHPDEIGESVTLARREAYAKPAPVDDNDSDTWPADRLDRAREVLNAAGGIYLMKSARETREAWLKRWVGKEHLQRDAIAFAETFIRSMNERNGMAGK